MLHYHLVASHDIPDNVMHKKVEAAYLQLLFPVFSDFPPSQISGLNSNLPQITVAPTKTANVHKLTSKATLQSSPSSRPIMFG